MLKKIDPRTKLIFVICISSLGVIIQDLFLLALILAAGILLAALFRAPLFSAFKKIRRLFFIFFGIIFIQSLFNNEGNVIIGTQNFKLLTDSGVEKGIAFILRFIVIIVAATILSTSGTREIIQGLILMKLPYEIAFMVSLGIKFVPVFFEEISDTVTAIQLRGIHTKKLCIRQKIELYRYIFTPIVVNTLIRAKKISLSVETRGFRGCEIRTSIISLKFGVLDYLSILLVIGFSFFTVYLYYFRF